MSSIASQITSHTVVYSSVYSDADQRKHQSSVWLAFVWGIHRDRWIPRTNGQIRGKCSHLMTSSWSDLGVTQQHIKIWQNPDVFVTKICGSERICKVVAILISEQLELMGQIDQWPLLTHISWYPLVLLSHCNSFEDRVPVDFIYGYPIFIWVVVTWPNELVPA